jgi:hypothetical protein
MDGSLDVKQIKTLLKKYHPDMCQDETQKDEYTEKTKELTALLAEQEHQPDTALEKLDDWALYKLGIKFERKADPERLFHHKGQNFESLSCEEQKGIIKDVEHCLNIAYYCFKRIAADFPQSIWCADAKQRIILLDKLKQRWTTIQAQDKTIDTSSFMALMNLKMAGPCMFMYTGGAG